MAFTPTAGQTAVLKLSMTGGTADTIVPGVNWKLNLDAKTRDVSNFRDGRARIGTLADATLSVSMVWDSAEQQTKASSGTGIRLGVTGTAKCFTDASKFFSVPVIVAQVGPNNEGVEGVVTNDVTFELNGSITYPTDT
jgi:hypothetical protein